MVCHEPEFYEGLATVYGTVLHGHKTGIKYYIKRIHNIKSLWEIGRQDQETTGISKKKWSQW